MRVWGIIKEMIVGSISAIEATGVSYVLEILWRTFGNCHPQSESSCNKSILQHTVASSLAISWLDYVIKWIPLSESYKRNGTSRTLNIWGDSTDVIKNFTFYLQAALAIYVEIYGKEKEMDDRWESPLILFLTFLAALLTNNSIRNYLHDKCARGSLKGPVAKVFDGIFGGLRGFAAGRSFLSSIESILDSYGGTDLVFSRKGMAYRYIFGGLVGIVGGFLHYKHSPEAMMKPLFEGNSPDKLKKIYRGSEKFLSSTTFILSLASSVKNLEEAQRGFISTGFVLLVPAAAIRGVYKCCAEEEERRLVVYDGAQDNALEESKAAGGSREQQAVSSAAASLHQRLLSPNRHGLWSQSQTSGARVVPVTAVIVHEPGL